MNRKLLRSEHLIATWQDITLTTHRIWQVAREGSSASMMSIPVDAVQWVRLGRHHLPWLLWLAAVTAVLGIVALEHDRNITYGLFGVALLLMLLYGTSRRLVLEIGAGEGNIVVLPSVSTTAGQFANVQFVVKVVANTTTNAVTGSDNLYGLLRAAAAYIAVGSKTFYSYN